MNPSQIHRRSILAATAGYATIGRAQLPDPTLSDAAGAGTESKYASLILPEPKVSRWRFGMTVSTPSACKNVLATFAVPRDFPEQTVVNIDRQLDAPLRVDVRDLPQDCARQVVITAPALRAGAESVATVDMEITRHDLGEPSQTDALVVPARLDRDLRMFVGNSPHIDASHGTIRRAARDISDQSHANAWALVRAIYDFVKEKVQYVEGPIRNASDALDDGKGDCEDMTSLFVALCRNARIPARMVWVIGHCYPEFYLEDPDGVGHWYPCQAAGDDQFGKMQESRPIMQKGDRFKVPEQNGSVRYLAEYFTCTPTGRNNPRLTWHATEIVD